MNLSILNAGVQFIAVAVLLAGCTAHVVPPTREDVVFERLAPGVWLHTSYYELPGIGPVPSNGLIVVDGEEATLIDTAWTEAQTATVLDWAKAETGVAVTRAVFTHAHQDKMGGVGVLRQRGIETFAHRLSNELASSRDLVPAEFELDFGDGTAALGSVLAFYPGPGHTRDNIVIWHGPSKILFGGCLVRPAGAKTLGNTADAVVADWADSVRNTAVRFGRAGLVIPSHGRPGGAELLEETIGLAEGARRAGASQTSMP